MFHRDTLFLSEKKEVRKDMKTCKVFVPAGALGTGISKETLEGGIKLKPDIISCDAGSTDSGPYYLGTGQGKYAREAVKEDMRCLIRGAKQLSIPITLGSCGTCGSDYGVDWMAEICAELCREEQVRFKIARIYTQQRPAILQAKYTAGKVQPLEAAPDIGPETFDECTNLVALAGAEPFIQALDAGADIVLCGRATDTAIIAALPLKTGCNEAAAWHGAKITECGGLCTEGGGGVFLTVDEEGFTVEAVEANSKCTVYSVSAHMLYENADPYHLTEPGGRLDTTQAVYTQVDERRVRVTGSRFEHASQYTMKLEGAASAGYQTISIVGIRDRRVLENPMAWINGLKAMASSRLPHLGIRESFSYEFKPYGWNAVTGEEIEAGSYVPREIGIILVVTAESQKTATEIAKLFNPGLLHFPVKKGEPLPSFAFPFSPAEIEKGRIYEFRLNHVVEVDNPTELVRIVYTEREGS
jgi:hypothetical protein